MEDCFRHKQGLYLLFLFSVTKVLCVSIHYSVPEEKKRGSLVANVLKDLKLGVGELSARRAQLVSKSSGQYFQFDTQSGNLLINDKIDREILCGQTEPCLLLSQIVLQNPLKIYSIEMKVEDVNDNAPNFSKNEFQLEIPENVPVEKRFPLESAQDEDLGENSIQNYTLSPNEHFRLSVENNVDGGKYVDLILEKPLDRESQSHLGLTMTAVDGGVPQRTGTVLIRIEILDNNDNFPQFTQSEYNVKLKENSSRNTIISRVEAKDLDFGSNAQITYSFHRVSKLINNLFHLNEMTGEISVLGEIDYEKETKYEMNIRATDGGGLSGHCKVLVEVEDVNDNAPEISVISINSPLPEDSPLETLVALFSITDEDSGDNGKTLCSVDMNLPFVLKGTTNNFYQLLIQSSLDRERVSEYNITITAIDWGSPRLTSTIILSVQISDVNDNPPVFLKSLFEMHIQENNIPGLLIGAVHAVDLDMGQNAKLVYSILPEQFGDDLVASYISMNSETGNMYALRSLDYEQKKDFKVTVRAADNGIPSLSTDVTVQVVIIDENDNAPFFLYPLQNSTLPCNELLPKMAEAGYLITKVVAVDGDSGQNSWLSYEILKATDPGLFSIGAQNGEVKTKRPLTEKDTNRQRLVITVKDNGVPPQTSTAMLNILLVDGFSDPYLKVVDVRQQDPEDEGTLTMYLVICLASVSFVFLLCIVSFVGIKMCKKDHGSSFIVAPPHFPPAIPENCTDSQSGSLSRNYQYDVCLTNGSLSSEFRFLRPLIPVFSVADQNFPVNHNTCSGSQDSSEKLEDSQSKEQVRERFFWAKRSCVILHTTPLEMSPVIFPTHLLSLVKSIMTTECLYISSTCWKLQFFYCLIQFSQSFHRHKP
uniref:Protocadherin beta-1 n=1 Tax=Anolis carolinensis TaxID=28377 RepID=D0IQ36_ANOCA|nr:TPA_inf: protocadherin beta 9 [Anolis carolinensis]